MQQAAFAEREYLNTRDAIKYWGFSQRKFNSFLKNGEYDFIAYYGKRRLILRDCFERYLWRNPNVREALKKRGTER